MNIILLEKRKGANLGETTKVRRGYARYLIRNKKALPYSEADAQQFTQMRHSLEQQENEKLQEAQRKAEQLKSLSFKISSRSADEIRLYGSIGPREIAEVVTQAGVSLEKRAVNMPKGPIRHLGDHTVMIHLHDQVQVPITIHIVPTLH